MTARVRATAQRYGRFAPVYRRYWAPLLVELSAPLLRELKPPRGAHVVDLGAGVGSIAMRVARRTGASVIGLDASEPMLRETRSARVLRAAADIERIPLRPNAVDFAVSTFVLQHIAKPANVFAEVARVLRPGGAFGTATWSAAADEIGGPYDVAISEIERAGAGPDPGAITTWHHLVDDPKKMQRLAARAGFESARSWTEEMAYQWTEETFFGWLSTQGPFYRRLGTLPERERDRALERIRKGIARLRPVDFVWRPTVVFTIARR